MPKPQHCDRFFLAEFRDHVGSSLACACDLTGPDVKCDVGEALHRAAFQVPWEERNKAHWDAVRERQRR